MKIEETNGYKFLQKVNGRAFEVAAYFYLNYLKTEEDEDLACNLFRHLISLDVISDGTQLVKEDIDDEEYTRLVNDYSGTIERIVDNMIEEKLPEEEFYKKLWLLISEDTVFTQDKDKICAIICLISNEKIPYYKLDDIQKIDESEFDALVDVYIESILKINFIVKTNREHLTDLSYRIIKLLDGIEDEKAKTVVLSQAFGEYLQKIKALIERIEELEESTDENHCDE